MEQIPGLNYTPDGRISGGETIGTGFVPMKEILRYLKIDGCGGSKSIEINANYNVRRRTAESCSFIRSVWND